MITQTRDQMRNSNSIADLEALPWSRASPVASAPIDECSVPPHYSISFAHVLTQAL